MSELQTEESGGGVTGGPVEVDKDYKDFVVRIYNNGSIHFDNSDNVSNLEILGAVELISHNVKRDVFKEAEVNSKLQIILDELNSLKLNASKTNEKKDINPLIEAIENAIQGLKP